MSAFRTIVGIIGGFFLVAGLGVFGYQVYDWYKLGRWFEMDLLWMVQRLLSTTSGNDGSSFLASWFFAPQDWLGLHRILMVVLEIIPLGLFFIIIGSFLFASIDRKEKERRRIIAEVEEGMRAKQAG